MSLNILLMLAAAIAGVATLFPRRDAYPSLERLRLEVLKRPNTDAELMYADEQLRTYNYRVKSLARRSWFIRTGFSLLALSIATRAAIILDLHIAIGK